MAILVNVGRYDTYAALPTGSKNVISGRETPGCKGEIVSTLAVSPTHTSSDISGSYSGGRYHWGQLISPCYETTARFDTLVPSWDAKTPAGTWLELELRVRCAGALGDASLWERELAVPARSQMVYPNGGETWCSPVSLWMVMVYWADRTGREDIN